MTDIPMSYQWKTYTRWGKEYGPLVSVKVMGQHVIVVNSADVAHDLFDKRDKFYSGRPEVPMVKLYVSSSLPLSIVVPSR